MLDQWRTTGFKGDLKIVYYFCHVARKHTGDQVMRSFLRLRRGLAFVFGCLAVLVMAFVALSQSTSNQFTLETPRGAPIEVVPIIGHSHFVESVTFSPNGRII